MVYGFGWHIIVTRSPRPQDVLCMFCRMCGIQMTFHRHRKFYRSAGASIDFVHKFYSKDLYSVHAKLIMTIGGGHKSEEVNS